MKKPEYKKGCKTCAYEYNHFKIKKRCSPCLVWSKLPNYRPKWYLRIFGKLVTSLLVAITIIGMYATVAQAAEPEEDAESTAHTIKVTIDDITAVSAQLSAMDDELDMLARLVWSEARGVDSTMEQAAVIWCVLNRVDSEYWASDIKGVVTARSQFAYTRSAPVTDEFRELARDVVTRWLLEARGIENVGRVLPREYCYFAGRGGHNHFRDAYRGGNYWDWSLPDVYEEVAAE
jgi:hypothetical protein